MLCDFCCSTFSASDDTLRKALEPPERAKFPCRHPTCPRRFISDLGRNRHEENEHGLVTGTVFQECQQCGVHFNPYLQEKHNATDTHQ